MPLDMCIESEMVILHLRTQKHSAVNMNSTDLRCIQCYVNFMALDALNKNNRLVLPSVGRTQKSEAEPLSHGQHNLSDSEKVPTGPLLRSYSIRLKTGRRRRHPKTLLSHSINAVRPAQVRAPAAQLELGVAGQRGG